MRRRGAVCAMVLGLTAAATQAEADPWGYGVRAGFHEATIRGEFADVIDPKTQTGVAAGGFVEYTISNALGLQMEADYIQKGFRLESSVVDDQGNFVGTQTVHLRLQYVEVPVLLRVSLPKWGSVTPYLIGGPTLGFGIKARVEVEDGQTSDLDNLTAVDPGLAGGLGLRFGRGPLLWGVDARYGTGFRDLWDISGNLESINQGMSFTLTVSR